MLYTKHLVTELEVHYATAADGGVETAFINIKKV
jgi:hypothetical protein